MNSVDLQQTEVAAVQPQNPALENLSYIGEGKKYLDVMSADKALGSHLEHISTLVSEREAQRVRMQELEDANKKLQAEILKNQTYQSAADLLKQKAEKKPERNPMTEQVQQNPTPDLISALVKEELAKEMAKMEAQKAEQSYAKNLEAITSEFQQNYGDPEAVFKQIESAYGADAKNLAKQSPEAVKTLAAALKQTPYVSSQGNNVASSSPAKTSEYPELDTMKTIFSDINSLDKSRAAQGAARLNAWMKRDGMI